MWQEPFSVLGALSGNKPDKDSDPMEFNILSR